MGTPARSAQTVSWSAAAARKVSPAQMMTRRPTVFMRAASLPMVVVLPTPLTPMMSSTMGEASLSGGALILSIRIFLSSSRALAGLPIFSARHFSFNWPTTSSDSFMPTSAMMRMSVSSS